MTDTMTEKIVFTRGVPPPEAFPTEEMGACFDAAVRGDAATVLQYGQQRGYAPLRRQLAEEYGVSETEILVGNGSLQLQDLVASYLSGPGTVVYTEQPSYDRAIKTFRRRGARAIGIPLEEDGISVERLEAALEREVPALVYLVPDFQNPAGATLSLEKRRRIVELAVEHDFWVIEDIPYRKLRYEGEDLPLLREIDASRVITMSSFSKLLSPGIRVGFMIAPEGLIDAVTALGEDTYLAPVLPTQATVSEFMSRGLLEPNIERLKELYIPRWRTMSDAVRRELPDAQAFIPGGGFFVSVMLPEDANTTNLVGPRQRRGPSAHARRRLLRGSRRRRDRAGRPLRAAPLLRRDAGADRGGRQEARKPVVAVGFQPPAVGFSLAAMAGLREATGVCVPLADG
jgi:DNA-binding transcriptional MocR family regulator